MFQDKYTDSTHQIPSDNIDPSEKRLAPYSLKWAQAVYQMHVRDQGGIRYTKLQDIDLNRQYAEGRQPVEKYLDILCPKDKATGQRRSFLDISTDILSIIPKFRSIVIGKFLQMDHDIIADAIDEKSSGEKRDARYKLWAKAQTEKMLKPIEQMAGLELSAEETNEILPSSIQELDMLESTGAFKLKWEAGMEKLLKDAFYCSNWNEIKVRAYEDIFDLGLLATRDYTDKVTGKAKARYVDPKRLIVRHSREHNYENVDYIGEIVDLTPNQIRVDAGEQIPMDELNRIIQLYADSNHLDFVFNENINDLYEQFGNLEVKVMDLTWKTIDTTKQEKKTDVRGHARYYNKDYNYELSEEQIEAGNREVLVGKKHMVYKCKWILGSDYVYDFGVEEDIIRPTKKTVKLPFNIYRLSRKSILDSIIPLEDNIQLAWLKFQNCLAKASPSGIAVDVSALKNISSGKNKLSPLEILKIRRETGDLLYKSTTHHSQVISPNAGRPIIELPGGAGAELDEHMKVIDFNINMIRQITGINPLMDATAPAPNTLVGTAEIAQQGTNNTLFNLYNAYRYVKEATASNLSIRIQNIIRYDCKLYEPVIGNSLLHIFKQGNPIAHADYGIRLSLKPQDEEKQRLLQKTELAWQQQMINYSDYMYIEQEINHGSIKMARIFMMYREELYKKQKQAEMEANVQAQSQAIQEQQKTGLEIDFAKLDKESGNTINEMTARQRLDIEEYYAKHGMKKDQDNNQTENKIKEKLYS